MMLKIDRGSDRLMAWTDKKNGFLQLSNVTVDARETGYWRGDKKYLSDFFISTSCDEADLYRTNADYTEVRPDGLTAVFPGKRERVSLSVSLLLHEQAFYISRTGGSSVGILFAEGVSCGDRTSWTRVETEGMTCWYCTSGVAIASSNAFSLDTASDNRVCLCRADAVAYGTVNDGTVSADAAADANACWYLSFAETAERARDIALSLVSTRAIESHRAKIDGFLSHCTVESGDARFDDAVRWAQFSAWMLSVDDDGKGIWGGLPWFRENWSRDSFLSLCGALLVSGCFAEARAIIVAAARAQNLDRSSADYGRLPNRWKGGNNRIYNTADGTLWFIRSVWEYVQYSGDVKILDEVGGTIDVALESDRTLRCDEHGFLRHDDAETWMDARTSDGTSYSPRGESACEIQSLWYSALLIGTAFARMAGDDALAQEREGLAFRVRIAFHRAFWSDERNSLADCVSFGDGLEAIPDFRVRPNQLLSISVPSVLADGVSDFLEPSRQQAVVDNATRELASPAGLFTLCPDDPLFHPLHENPEFHHKDAAYHNGTIWLWMTGAYVSSCARVCRTATLGPTASALLANEAAMILDTRCAGALDGIAQAELDADGNPVFTGVWSQARSESEFSRNVWQDITGFKPRLAENRLEIKPHLPAGVSRWCAEAAFGANWTLSIDLERDRLTGKIACTLVWKGVDAAVCPPPLLVANGVPIFPSVPLELTFDCANGATNGAVNGAMNGPSPFSAQYRVRSFAERDLRPDWCVPIHEKDALERLVTCAKSAASCAAKCGMRSLDAGHTLESYFDSDRFKRKYLTSRALGALYENDKTVFRVWAPTARSVCLILYPDGDASSPSVVLPMEGGSALAGTEGVWELTMSGDLHGAYYRYRLRVHGIVRECADPYARACGVNGVRSMVVDFSRTNPGGWKTLSSPKSQSANDAIVYETHVADITSSPFWNGDPRTRRTYSGASTRGTSYKHVESGFDHIRSLGITHVQLLPVFDFSSVDESRINDPSYSKGLAGVTGGIFNWGYDPFLWTSPEGSYSSDAHNGVVRIIELKAMLREFLSAGIGVIMDVVYNHVPCANNHPFGICVPGYYFRCESFSGAGDDTASERAMFERFMVDSLSWWLSEYKLSGFRFDLMGLHDVETMNAVASSLRRIKSDVILYGEGWDMYRGGKMVAASMLEARKLEGFGFFNDAFRFGVKGPVFSPVSTGFIHDGSHREALKFGLVGAVFHTQVHNRLVEGSANRNPWTDRTASSVNFAEIHDNLTLYDKLVLAEPLRDDAWYVRLQRMAIALVLFAQGMPVLHAGMEFMRTKEIPADLLEKWPDLGDLSRTPDGKRAFSHNSYNLTDRINALDWNRCANQQELVGYVRALIAVRREHPVFRLRTEREVGDSLIFIDVPAPLLAWTIDGRASGDIWRSVCIVVNPGAAPVAMALPFCPNGGEWKLVTDGTTFMPVPMPASEPSSESLTIIAPKALYLYAEF